MRLTANMAGVVEKRVEFTYDRDNEHAVKIELPNLVKFLDNQGLEL